MVVFVAERVLRRTLFVSLINLNSFASLTHNTSTPDNSNLNRQLKQKIVPQNHTESGKILCFNLAQLYKILQLFIHLPFLCSSN